MSDSILSAAVDHDTPDDADWPALNARRADIYAWFSALFAAELTNEGVAAYQNGDADNLLAALSAAGLSEEVARLRAAVSAWTAIASPRVELAADFASLFLIDARYAAMPYASAYLDPEGQLYGEPHQKMRGFLLGSGLQLSAAFKEPADHLSVYLAYIETQARQASMRDDVQLAAASQAAFLNDALLTWLPRFVERCQHLRGDAASDFYPAAAALLVAFVSEDAACLEAMGGLS